MWRASSSLASAMLSLLMILTSVSASACDLSCWLHKAHSDCHAAGSAAQAEETSLPMSSAMDMSPDDGQSMMGSPMHADATTDDSMAMSADLDMGHRHRKSVAGSGADLSAAPRHSMAMSTQLEGTTERFVRAAKAETRMAMPDHSGTLSSCKHEPCSQASVSVSPATGHRSQPISVHWMPTGVSNAVNPWVGLPWIGPGTPPPIILAVARLATALRI
jgi:uncharacterized glyoxalase superfamily protein PhnB